MSEQISGQLLNSLLQKNYGVTACGEPFRLPGEGGQHVFKVGLDNGEAWTVRLGLALHSKEKLLAEIGVLRFVNQADFPAPRPKTTQTGEVVFEWQPGLWGYALEYIQGQHPARPVDQSRPGPVLDRVSLAELGHLLGRLHNLAFSDSDHLADSSWLDEVPQAIERAGQAAANPVWAGQAREVVATLKGLPLAQLKALPRVLIHTDAHEGNLLWTPQGELYLLDWENAGVDTAVIDIALVLSWLCSWQPAGQPAALPEGQPTGQQVKQYDFDEDYCKSFLENYQQERALTRPERQMLGPAIQFFDGWFAARDMQREVAAPGSAGEMAWLNWAFMRSVTPQWATTLARWAGETAPGFS